VAQPWEYEPTYKRNRRIRRGFEREARFAGFNTLTRRSAQAQGIDPDIVPQRPTMFDKRMITGRYVDAELEPLPETKGKGLLGKVGAALDSATSTVFGGEIREPWDVLRPLKRALDAEARYISRPLAEGIYEGVGFGDYDKAPGVVKFGLEGLLSPSTYVGPGIVGKLGAKAGIAGAGRFAAKESVGRYVATNVAGVAGAAVGSELAEQAGLPAPVGGLAGAIAASSALLRGAKPPIAEAGGAKGDLPHPMSRYGYQDQAAKFGTTEGDDALRGQLNASGRGARTEARDQAASMEGFYPRWEDDPSFGALDLDVMGVEPDLLTRVQRLREQTGDGAKGSGQSKRELGRLEAQLFFAERRERGMSGTSILNEAAGMIETEIDRFRRSPRNAKQVAFEAELERLWGEPAFMAYEDLGFELVEGAVMPKRAAEIGGEAFRGEQGGLQPGMFSPEEVRRPGTQIGMEEGLTPAAVTAPASAPRPPREPVPSGVGARQEDFGGGFEAPPPPRRPGGGEPPDGFDGDDFPVATPGQGQQSEVAFRELLGGEMPAFELTQTDRALNAMKRTIGIGIEDEPIATSVMRHRKDLKLKAESLANRLSTVAGARARQVFKTDAQGRIVNLPLKPTIQDVAARLPRYREFLDADQLAFLEELRGELGYYRAALNEMGVEVKTRADVMEGGFYIPRGGASPEDLDLPTKISAGRGRAGSKKGFERPASFPSQTQGISSGFEYVPFEEAIRAYGLDAADRSINAYASRVLANVKDESGKLLGETQSMRLWRQNPGLAQQMTGLREKVASLTGSAARLDAKTHKVWQDFLDSVDNIRQLRQGGLSGIKDPDLDDLRESLIGLRITRGMFKGMGLEETREAIMGLKAEIAEVRPQWKAAVDKARLTPRDAGQIGIAQLNGTTFPIQMANAANKFLAAEAPSGALSGSVRALNALMRGLNATADLSFIGIQGLLGLAYDPAAYGRAWKVAMKSLGDKDAMNTFLREFDRQAVIKGLPSAREWSKGGLRFGSIAHEYAIGGPGQKGLLGLSDRIGRAPVVEQSNRSFGVFGDAMRLEAAQVMYATSKAKNVEQLAQAANLMTGWTKGKFMGDAGEFVQFAPRFFQSQIELVGRALADGSETGQRARTMLLKLLGIGTLTTLAANEVLGNPTDLNPTSPNFMRIRVGGQDVSLFGTWDSLTRAIIRAAEGDFEYLVRTKASPLLRQAWDAMTGRNFIGEPAFNPLKPRQAAEEPERIESFLRSILPISVQDTVREGPEAGTAFNFAGVKASPLSRADVLDEIARDAFGRGWHDLDAADVDELALSNPEKIDAKSVRAARGVKETLQPYWDLEDEVWDRINDRPEFKAYETADDFFDAKTEELKRAGVPEHQIAQRLQELPVSQQLQRAVSELRRRYRMRNQDAEQLLVEWYGYSPIQRGAQTDRQLVATR
jgi:hypothetical protein